MRLKKSANKKESIFKIVSEYYQDGYFSLGMEYLKNQGLKQTIKKTKQILKKKRVKPIQITTDIKEQGLVSIEYRKKTEVHSIQVDIIICVHNAYKDVKRCLESVYEYTTEPYNIIIVDDGSEKQTQDYLYEQYLKHEDKIKLIRNEDGHGYAIAANIGMKSSSADYFVLLNSDTIVSHNWLDLMLDCALSDDKIGIIGPLSNTASWQSVPKLEEHGDWCHNDLPDFVTVDDMAKWTAYYSGNIYLNVPLVNGFCMLVAQRVVCKIGYFDEENFGKGFGEEDDFNLRAFKAGFRLAIADNVYVYHAQSRSYSDDARKELCKVSGEKIRKKHGDVFLEQCVSFMKNNYVLEGIRFRTAAFIEREKLKDEVRHKWGDKKILFHLPCAEAGGGANVIIQEFEYLLDLGIRIDIYNLEANRAEFEASYPNLKIPVIYGADYSGFIKYLDEFDVVCMTYYKAVKYCSFNKINPNVKLVYYIQDFEPYFFKEGSRPYKEALLSYKLIDNMICVTKTKWNYDTVKEKTGRESIILGPSVNIDLFRPRRPFLNQDIINITAMIRPSSPRRAPEKTMKILQQIGQKYGDRVNICIFGCNSEEYEDFFREAPTDFTFKNYGVVNPNTTASLLSNTDIFVDFSSFQAMGLTAMEAMASGCAVIVPEAGGTSSFAQNGSNCLVIDTLSERLCYDKLCLLIEDEILRNKLSFRAISDMCQYYPERCMYRLLEAIFA